MGHEQKYPIYFALSDILGLRFHLKDTRPGVELDTFVVELVQRWLAVDMERLALRRDGPSLHGFQWKNVFLPEGTNLRTSYQHTVEFAKVVGDRIMTDAGEELTPSQFANRHAKGRNAWRFIWVRLPGEARWVRAINYRASVDRQMPA